ncbi:MAG: type II secretion system GspH family protein [Planctomycetaceae bacterium]|nr:type II secretion system GspH family protein [Planctomycetaceae bacterium]
MKAKGFTLIELMVVILIVGILAAASIPLMRGRIDSAKWSEANAIAGTIRSAVRVAYAEDADAKLTGTLNDPTLQASLGFNPADLTGTYFAPGDFNVDTVDEDTGIAVITVTSDGTGKKPAAGSYVLTAEGEWDKQ